VTDREDRRETPCRSGGATLSRRALLLAGAALAPAAAQAQPGDASAFMARVVALRAAALAAGDQPYGAVVVRDGRIIGEAPSRVVTAGDPTAHAEMEAIRAAARTIASRDLSGAVMYSSARPCPMCEAAAAWAGVARMIHGEQLADAGAPRVARC